MNQDHQQEQQQNSPSEVEQRPSSSEMFQPVPDRFLISETVLGREERERKENSNQDHAEDVTDVTVTPTAQSVDATVDNLEALATALIPPPPLQEQSSNDDEIIGSNFTSIQLESLQSQAHVPDTPTTEILTEELKQEHQDVWSGEQPQNTSTRDDHEQQRGRSALVTQKEIVVEQADADETQYDMPDGSQEQRPQRNKGSNDSLAAASLQPENDSACLVLQDNNNAAIDADTTEDLEAETNTNADNDDDNTANDTTRRAMMDAMSVDCLAAAIFTATTARAPSTDIASVLPTTEPPPTQQVAQQAAQQLSLKQHDELVDSMNMDAELESNYQLNRISAAFDSINMDEQQEVDYSINQALAWVKDESNDILNDIAKAMGLDSNSNETANDDENAQTNTPTTHERAHSYIGQEDIIPPAVKDCDSVKEKSKDENESTVGLIASFCIGFSSGLFIVLLLWLPVYFLTKDQYTDIRIETDAPQKRPWETKNSILSIIDLPDYTIDKVRDERDSPQYHAFQWLKEDPNLNDLPEWKRQQRFALACLYYATTNEENAGWHNDQGWLEYTDECTWYFSTLSDNISLENVTGATVCATVTANGITKGHVEHLWLVSNGLRGPIPPEIFLLTSLETIDFEYNSISSTLPLQIGRLRRVQQIKVILLIHCFRAGRVYLLKARIARTHTPSVATV